MIKITNEQMVEIPFRLRPDAIFAAPFHTEPTFYWFTKQIPSVESSRNWMCSNLPVPLKLLQEILEHAWELFILFEHRNQQNSWTNSGNSAREFLGHHT